MDMLDRMNGMLDYIEHHLTDKVDYDQAAAIACCSTYHLQRMFPFITEVPLSEYIRHRRLTLAAFDLQNSDEKVIDLALKYGYESPEAFTRAFKKCTESLRQTHASPASCSKLIHECPFNFLFEEMQK